MMSRDGGNSSLHIHDLGSGTSTSAARGKHDNATIFLENRRLKKENDELWMCLELMKKNSELECANLISSVITWCDDKFKHRFLELNAAITRHNYAKSPFRPITPTQSPTSANYSPRGGRSPFLNRSPEIFNPEPNISSVSRQSPVGSIRVYSPTVARNNYVVSPTQGSVFDELIQTHPVSSRRTPPVNGVPLVSVDQALNRSTSPTPGIIYETSHQESYCCSFSPRNRSPINLGTVDNCIPTIASQIQGNISPHTQFETLNETSSQTFSPTHGCVHGEQWDVRCVSPERISPVSRGSFNERRDQTLSPTQGQIYVGRYEDGYVSPSNVSQRNTPLLSTQRYDYGAPQNLEYVSPMGVSPDVQRSLSPGRIQPSSPIQGDAYGAPQDRGYVSPRGVSPEVQRSLSPARIQPSSPIKGGDYGTQQDRGYVSPRGVFQELQRSLSPGRIQLSSPIQMNAYGAQQDRGNVSPGGVSLEVQRSLSPGGIQFSSSIQGNAFGAQQGRGYVSPVQISSPIHGNSYESEQNRGYMSHRSVSPVSQKSFNVEQDHPSSSHQGRKYEHDRGYISPRSVSPVRSPMGSMQQAQNSSQSGYISPRNVSPQRLTPTAPMSQDFGYEMGYQRPVSPRSISPTSIDGHGHGRSRVSSRGFIPDTPISTHPTSEISANQFVPINDSAMYHVPPELINSPFYRPISPSQLHYNVSSPAQRISPKIYQSSQSPIHSRSPTHMLGSPSQQVNESMDSSGFFQDSYSRYPSTLNSNALESILNSVHQQSAREMRTTTTSPMIRQRSPSPTPQHSLLEGSGMPITMQELSFGPSRDAGASSPAHGSSTFMPEVGVEERVPTPYPYGPRSAPPPVQQQPHSMQKQLQTTPKQSHFSSYGDRQSESGTSSVGSPVAFSTPKREPKKKYCVSPIPELSEKDQYTNIRRPVPVFQMPIVESPAERSKPFRPSHRLLGEISFQLERRILDYIFSKRVKGQKLHLHRRFYGYTVSNIPAMIKRESTCKDGSVDFKKKVTYEFRYERITNQLAPFGYVLGKHCYHCLKMINKYGILSQPPDRETLNVCGLQEPNTLRMYVCNLTQNEKERVNMMVVLESLLLLAHDDGQSIFLW